MVHRGNQRERAVAIQLRELGYLVASLRHVGGPADLLAVPKAPSGLRIVSPTGNRTVTVEPGMAYPVTGSPPESVRFIDPPKPLLVEVKGTKDYPWRSTWGPDARALMIEAGVTYGVEPILAWWPPSLRGGPIWLPVEDWPA